MPRGRLDILFKLRLFFWMLVLVLWGMFMYQFMSKDISGIQKFRLVKNPFQTRPAPVRVVPKRIRPAPVDRSETGLLPGQLPAPSAHLRAPAGRSETGLLPGQLPAPSAHLRAPAGRSKTGLLPQAPSAHLRAPAGRSKTGLLPQAPSWKLLKPIPTGDIIDVAYKSPIINAEHSSQERQSLSLRISRLSEPWPDPPPGFTTARIKHFVIYQEGPKIAQELLSNIELLHGNLMLDLVAFSPWSRDKKVLVYFFKTQAAYRKTTGRPSWSGGASSLSKRIIYIYESREAFGILAHELCHLYFDSFFNASRPSPLWLSEGMATLIQTERGMSPPNWLRANLKLLSGGGGFGLADLMRIDDTRHASEASVRLWYAQSYSLVRFLMRMKPGDSFYQFCKMLRDDHRVNASLFRAYGMPFNRVKALEYAWRYEIRTQKLGHREQRPFF